MNKAVSAIIGLLEEARDIAEREERETRETAEYTDEYYPIGDGRCSQTFMDDESAWDCDMWEEIQSTLSFAINEIKEVAGCE